MSDATPKPRKGWRKLVVVLLCLLAGVVLAWVGKFTPEAVKLLLGIPAAFVLGNGAEHVAGAMGRKGAK